MIRNFIFTCALATTMVSHAAMGQDFSVGSNAKEFGLIEETPATFSAKVVDPLCELTGDCPDQCGKGQRFLALIRETDRKMIMVLKNAQFAFNGPVPDLLPFCNRQVEVDGLMIGDEEEHQAQFYMVQLIREKGVGEWSKANNWTAAWKARNPEVAQGKGPWYRRDPLVLNQIEKDGYFGIGLEADEQYRKENQ